MAFFFYGSANFFLSSPCHGADAPSEPSFLEEPLETIADPIEPVNRLFFHVNDKLYFWIFKPVASGYKGIVPQEARIGVHNFFSNVATPIRLVNCLLQAKFKSAGNEAARLLLNTTFGMAGFLDPARKEFDIRKEEQDFGLTLGVWGMGPSFYINWPFFGPSNLRDTVGLIGDTLLDPRTYLINSFPADAAIWSYEKINEISLTMGEYEDLKKAALDPYIALREAFHQYRQNRIKEK